MCHVRELTDYIVYTYHVVIMRTSCNMGEALVRASLQELVVIRDVRNSGIQFKSSGVAPATIVAFSQVLTGLVDCTPTSCIHNNLCDKLSDLPTAETRNKREERPCGATVLGLPGVTPSINHTDDRVHTHSNPLAACPSRGLPVYIPCTLDKSQQAL